MKGENMEFQFENNSPIYLQLIQKIKMAIASGEFKPGEKLPPVRELAMESKINPNTVQRALFQLEDEHLIFTQRTNGKYITEDKQKLKELKKELASNLLQEFLVKMQQLGFSKQEILEFIERKEK